MPSASAERDDAELVPGLSAGWLDVIRRAVNVGSIVVPIAVGIVLNILGSVSLQAVLVVMVVLFAVGFVGALLLGSLVTRTMRREMEAGYSTMYDVADFALRDARTKQLLRPEGQKPSYGPRRSLLASMFQVKPGTLVAKRLEQDAKDAEEK